MNSECSSITGLSASKVVELLKDKVILPKDALMSLVELHKKRDVEINAIPTLCLERAISIGETSYNRAPLYGLPIVAKDMTPIKGIRTTYGSMIFKDNFPEHTDTVIENVERSGGVVYAKSNTPEFACGGTTYNDLFGETRNPWNIDFVAGGSSGGSAAALASGQAWLALGTDFGGSLRIPASFCGVVGLRPTPGLVPHGPTSVPYDRYWVEGPLGRNVRDVTLLLKAIVQYDSNDPLSCPEKNFSFEYSSEIEKNVKIAYVGNLGMGEVESDVENSVREALLCVQRELEWNSDYVDLDLSETRKIFSVRRGLHYVGEFYELREKHPNLIRNDILNDIEKGLSYTAKEIADIERAQGKLWYRCAEVFKSYDVLVSPTVAVAPFKAGEGAVKHINGIDLPTYYDWLKLTYSISMLGLPSISIPCGFSREGLPIGMQLIGRPYGEESLLKIAAYVEDAINVFKGVSVPWL